MIILLLFIILILIIEIKNENSKIKIIFYQDKIRKLYLKMRNEENINKKINLQHQLSKLSSFSRKLYRNSY
jgi:hypothetical protein